jgi:hypothetical protein
LLLLLIILIGFPAFTESDEQTVMALPTHALGDQTLSISAGLFIPLFYQDFAGVLNKSMNLSLGGTGSLQWNAYLSHSFLLGVEVAASFCYDPNKVVLLMLPLTIKATYVFSVSRFEFPIFLGAGISIMRYQQMSQVDIILKPGFAAYWRYDANWSFGFNCVWWLNMEPTTKNQPPVQAMMLNSLEITPSIFYHF